MPTLADWLTGTGTGPFRLYNASSLLLTNCHVNRPAHPVHRNARDTMAALLETCPPENRSRLAFFQGRKFVHAGAMA